MVTGNGSFWTEYSFSAYIMSQIMTDPDEAETGNSRMRQVSIMMYVYHIQLKKEPPTGSQIAKAFGLTRAAIRETMDQLVRKNLLVEEEVPNTAKYGQGRRALRYSISQNVFKASLDAPPSYF
uniref:hypothetical protein n=1 Tax=Ochrobactrum sp. LM19 TaxID=1449781 RepID=UPI0015E7FFAB|nr:hypothetical protein [Ochrobactrum sp. LM19]